MSDPEHDTTHKSDEPAGRLVGLAADLVSPEAKFDPDPNAYTGAAVAMVSYFVRRALRGFPAGEKDEPFAGAVDDAVSAVGGLYARDRLTHNLTAIGFGQHPADELLEQALEFAQHAQTRVEEMAVTLSHTSQDTATMLAELRMHKSVQDQEASEDIGVAVSLRNRAADTLNSATRSVDQHPYAYEYLSHVGNATALIINALSPVVARHEKDSDAPNLGDYIALHVSSALEATAQWQP